MATPGRNDPCSCGSGKKYKQCCMDAVGAVFRRRDECMQGSRIAADWLFDHHERACGTAISEDFYASLDDDAFEELEADPLGILEMTEVLAEDWLVAEAHLELDEDDPDADPVRALDLVLGPDGPPLTPVQRSFLEALGRATLGYYEVVSVGPSPQAWIRDRLFPERPPIEVMSRALADGAAAGDHVLLRLVPFDGGWVTSGVICPVSRGVGGRIQTEAGAFIAEHGLTWETSDHCDDEGDSVSAVCRDVWLGSLVRPAPTLVDRATGEPLMLVNDHYDVRDWERLAERLEREPDVEGTADRGWTRLHPAERSAAGIRSSSCALNPVREKHRLVCFARSMKSADESRVWFEALAGDAVTHLTREIVDPRSPAALEEFRRSAHAAPQDDPLADLGPEARRDVFQQLHEQIYARWSDEPVPVLAGKTPREAMATASGRAHVEQLVRDYERAESERAAEEGRPPVDYGFLWRSLGVDPAPAAGP